MLVSVVFALLVKANLFEVLSRLDAPWGTLVPFQLVGPHGKLWANT